ncbi:PREDICTED: uncharacterized protein LOC108612270 [Drosophila arizonae]|uniref:Uncharacterized protein LOC108612270 n=1 Tax=Drosophila arizonae TaxID=7263 RepID=A0ABM1P099_DROAR|nr:PREDICTED: uncharacterized protein LOC108612270 [Drosophila arizonae]
MGMGMGMGRGNTFRCYAICRKVLHAAYAFVNLIKTAAQLALTLTSAPALAKRAGDKSATAATAAAAVAAAAVPIVLHRLPRHLHVGVVLRTPILNLIFGPASCVPWRCLRFIWPKLCAEPTATMTTFRSRLLTRGFNVPNANCEHRAASCERLFAQPVNGLEPGWVSIWHHKPFLDTPVKLSCHP